MHVDTRFRVAVATFGAAFGLGAAAVLASAAHASAQVPQVAHGSGSGPPAAAGGAAEEILQRSREYRAWRKFAEYATAAKRSKAHTGNYVVAWYNDAAAAAAKAGGTQQFPDGSIIVKENRLTPDGPPASLSIMAKRAGSWFWISATPDWKVFTADGKPLAGDVGRCAGCHLEADRDMVYSK